MTKPTRPSLVTTAFLLLCASALMACGKGFQASTEVIDSASNGSLGDNPTGGDAGVNIEQKWMSVKNDTDALIEDEGLFGTYATGKGTMAIQIAKEREAIILILPLPRLFPLQVPYMALPQLPGASIEMVTQANGTQAMGVVIPLKYLIKGASFGNYGLLPNGNPVPGIPVGEARGFAINLPQNPNYRLHVYIAVNAAAVFIETPFLKLPDTVAAAVSLIPPIPIKNKTKQIGAFAFVPNMGVHASGVFVSARLPTPVAILIDELLRY